jgi:GT2 family glycosyltransferase
VAHANGKVISEERATHLLLTLVICTRGRTEQLRRLLESLRLQSEMSFKAIVVDQNEPGFLAPILDDFRDLPITHVRSPLGLSRARNAGIILADSPLVGFPDDDCWYRPMTVAEVISRFQNDPSLDVLTGRTVDADGADSVSAHLPVSQPITKANVFLAGNTNTFFARRNAVQLSEGFDETLGVGAGTEFGSGEETDFLIRCLNAGCDVRYERDFLVHHDQVSRDPATIGRYSTGFGRVARIHNLGTGFVGIRIVRAAARAALFALSGNIGEARSRWTWIKGCLAGFTASRP